MTLVKYFILLVLLFGCDYPHWRMDKFKLDAQFGPDGKCSFSIDDEVISSKEYRQRVSVISSDCGGCTADHLDGYWVWCTGNETFREDGSVAPSLAVAVIYEKGDLLRSGNYEILEQRGQFSQEGTIAEIINPPGLSVGGLANGITGADLVVTKGQFRLDEYDKSQNYVVGGLAGVARRRASGF